MFRAWPARVLVVGSDVQLHQRQLKAERGFKGDRTKAYTTDVHMLCHLKFSGAVFLFFWQRLSISSPSSPSLVLDFVAINWCGSQPWVSETSGGGALWELYEVDLTQMEKLWMYIRQSGIIRI